VDGSGRNFLGRFLGGTASPSSFAVTIASRVWSLLTQNAVNRGFFQCKQTLTHNKDVIHSQLNSLNKELRMQVSDTSRSASSIRTICYKKNHVGEWALSMVGVEEEREFRFRGDLYSQENTFLLV